MRSVIDLISGQMALFQDLPVQRAPDQAVAYAATLGPDEDPRRQFRLIKESACQRLLPDVLNWLDERDADETARAEVLASLIRAADPEGYRFARNLQRHWDGLDAEMVEILDSYDRICRDIVRQMLAAWVSANAITLELAPGARVRDLRPGPQSQRFGTVVALRPETAEYVVQFDDDRHRFAGTAGGTIRPHTHVQRLAS